MARKMKDSGIEWIGEIPEGWELTKVKRIFDIGRGRVISQQELTSVGYPVYSSQTKNNGCLGYISTYDFDKSQLTWTTDGVNAGTVFLREGRHNCTNVCGTLAPKNDTNDLRYLKYALEYIAFYHKRADINGFKIMNNEMAEIELLLPPLFEQQNIANYLDFKCSQTQSILEQSLFSIEEYKKLKQAVITQAVATQQCSHIKLKYLMNVIVDCPHETPTYSFTGNYYVIRTADQALASLRRDEDMYRLDASEYKKRTRRLTLDKDDIVYGREGERWGLACIVPESNKYCLGQRIMQFRCNTKFLYPKYAMYALNSEPVYLQGVADTIGSTSPHVNISTICNYLLPVPALTEQKEIADYLDAKCAEIDRLIAKKEQLVKELESYKKSLIYEVVTGKREV